MRVTIEDVARFAGVSKATVSRVINGNPKGVGVETRKKVKQVIEQIGYNPSLLERGIALAQTKSIGLIIPDISNPFFPELVKAVETQAAENGYMVILANTDFSAEKEQLVISTFINKRVDGIILTTASHNIGTVCGQLKKYQVPCVMLDRLVEELKDSSFSAGVFVDNEYATYIATEHLLKNGHRDIAFICGPDDVSTSQERLQGYLISLYQHGVPYCEELVCKGDYTMESGSQAVMELSRRGIPFTGLVASNDAMAIGAMKALRRLGLGIPEDVEVIGFDNIAFAEMMDPPLSTIQQPTEEMGRVAVRLLLEIISGKEPAIRHCRLQPKLILRQTTRQEGAE